MTPSVVALIGLLSHTASYLKVPGMSLYLKALNKVLDEQKKGKYTLGKSERLPILLPLIWVLIGLNLHSCIKPVAEKALKPETARQLVF